MLQLHLKIFSTETKMDRAVRRRTTEFLDLEPLFVALPFPHVHNSAVFAIVQQGKKIKMIGTTILKLILLPFIVASAVLRQADAKIQDKPLRISKDVTVMGTTYVTGEGRIASC